MLDLDGDGLELISVANSQAHFDFQGDGFAEATGWLGGDDGFLVRDLDLNGRIETSAELFGTDTQDGFSILSTLDSNHDGKIDASDDAFGDLKIWRDLDGDGQTDAGELQSLAAAGVEAISLSTQTVAQTVEGNVLLLNGAFTKVGGGSGTAGAVLFQTDKVLSQWVQPEGFAVDLSVYALPILKGYGHLADLDFAFTTDPSLATAMRTFVLSLEDKSGAEIRADFIGFLYKWAGVETVATNAHGANIDGKHHAFLEKFYGGPLEQDQPTGRYAPVLEQLFQDIVDVLLSRTLVQSASAIFAATDDMIATLSSPFIRFVSLLYDKDADALQGNVVNTLKGVFSAGVEDEVGRFSYFEKMAAAVRGLRLDAYGDDKAAFVTAIHDATAEITDLALRGLAEALGLHQAVSGDASSTTVLGTLGEDVLNGGAGQDVLTGGEAGDTYVFEVGDGQDSIIDGATTYGAGVDQVLLPGLQSAQAQLSRAGDDLLIDRGDGDVLRVVGQFAWSAAGHVERFVFADRDYTAEQIQERLLAEAATSGNDTIVGFRTDDVISGGGGDDVLNGAEGSDTFLYNIGDGDDRIHEVRSYDTTTIDQLKLGAGLNAADLHIARDGSTLTLSFSGQAGSIQLETMDDPYGAGLERVVFGDGAVWSRAQLLSAYVAQETAAGATSITGFDTRADVLTGTTANDTLVGLGGADTFSGGAGDDVLNGGDGSDTFLYNLGDGHDRIIETRSYDSTTIDTLKLGGGLNASDLHIDRTGSTLTLSFDGQAGSIQLETMDDAYGAGVERIVFGDGTTWTRADLLGAYVAQETAAGATSITGFDTRADVLTGTTGNDTLVGLGGADTFDGGAGDDVHNGGDGSDIFLYDVGDGHDRIIETRSYDSTTIDELRLGVGLNAADLWIARAGSMLTLSFNGQTGSIQLENMDDAYGGGVERILFGDGAVWTRDALQAAWISQQTASASGAITGFDMRNDVLTGTVANETLSGLGGADTYIYNAGGGNDRIVEAGSYDTTVDKLLLGAGLTVAGAHVTRAGNDFLLTFDGQSGSVQLINEADDYGAGVEQVVFSDGTVWTRQDMILAYQNATSTPGNDNIVGSSGADTLAGGQGDDLMAGGGGADTYVYGVGDGADRIVEERSYDNTLDRLVLGSGLNAADLQIARDGAILTLSFAGQSGSIRIDGMGDAYGAGIEQIVFGDGATWSRGDVLAAWIAQQVSANATTINGFEFRNDTLTSTAANQTLSGLGGEDTYVYNVGGGNDRIVEGSTYDSTADKLVLGAGLDAAALQLARDGSALTLSFSGKAGSIQIDGMDGAYGAGVEQIVFGDGTIWSRTDLLAAYVAQQTAAGATSITGFDVRADVLTGTDGDDALSGLGGNDTFTGGKGDDALNGGGGADTFVYNAGDGNDRIVEGQSYDATIDKLVLGAGLNASNLHLARAGAALTLSFDGQSGSIQIELMDNGFGGGVEQIVFGDGTIWSRADLLGAYLAQQAAAGATSITGFDTRADTLVGTVGADTLSGLAGADILTGGQGNDILNGGEGADTYHVSAGDGQDRIFEARSYDNTIDKLVLGAGLNANDLRITQIDADLRISFVGRTEAITITGGEDAYGNGLEQIVFADGTVWGRQELLAAPTAPPPLTPGIVGTSGDDTLNGASGADIIAGGAGNDTLRGGGGSDTYLYNSGDGSDLILEGPDSAEDRLVFGEGLTASDLVVTRGGSTGAVLSFAGKPGSITLDTQFYGFGWGVEKFQFADGTVWSESNLRAAYLAKASTSGADVILGFDGGDTLQGGLGDDVLRGGSGADTYVYALGDGADAIFDGPESGVDRLVFGAGISASDIIVTRGGSTGATLGFAGHAGQIVLDTQFYGFGWGVEQIVFSDGTVWSEADLRSAYLARATTSGADNIRGFDNVDDTLQGGLGDDLLRGGGGADTYVYNSGDGADSIAEGPGSGVDKLVFGAGITASDILVSRSGDTALLSFANAAGSIRIDTQFYGFGWGVEQVVFSDGTTWGQSQLLDAAWIRGDGASNMLWGGSGADKIDGGAGDDIIDAGGGADRIVGGGGADSLTGGAGADTFVFLPGFGKDTVADFKASDSDKLEVRGVFTDFAALQAASQQVGANVVTMLDGDNTITLKNVTLSTLVQDDFIFA